jgi:CHAD domain-containing protein
MKWKPSRAAIENARSELPKLLEKYLKKGRKACDGNRSPQELHNFRIKTKQFRYTLELFRPLYGARLEQDLEPIRELQRVLGKLHDYNVIAESLDGDKVLKGKLERLTKKKLMEFHEQWAAFDSKGQIKHWKVLLTGASATSSTVSSKRRARKRSIATT